MRYFKTIFPCFLCVFFLFSSVPAAYCQDVGSKVNSSKKATTEIIRSIPNTRMGRVEKVRLATTAIENLDISANYIVKTEGYRHATVSFLGQSKEVDIPPCRVGVVFIPNETQVLAAWKNEKSLPLSEEVTTGVNPANKYFQGQIDIDIKFPSYLLGFYNTCATEVELSLYTYLK